ncbi:uncharacterized protein LOC107841007 isoform X1 [Capsicum annuum]|uniref:uncharacterized protein LOC107841007 isoform X1 n=1 Tax=Capsicum annuum TaxID=4072 RepID=UPI001FB11E07|nr:uncharacterized protein LOC107841007 isoform X1 [Capsicum annuum]XP_047252511.1 uncharacterized protein LOC107841007 isoform X1 [Capsicum annuum]XP_047252512.1 uncharacterized protein LOC107841007 isoform X1 [Capsicum annuum]
MMGYSTSQKGYLLLDLDSNRLFVSRDVSLQEHVFPFANRKDKDDADGFLQLHDYHSEIEPDEIEDHVIIPSADTDGSPQGGLEPEHLAEVLPHQESNNDAPVTTEIRDMQHPLRRTLRVTKEPIWLKDYTTAGRRKGTRYPISHHLYYDNTSLAYQCYVDCFSALVEPQNFSEAAGDERWTQAMKLEIQALENNNTWELVDLPPGKNVIGSKWVYKIKYKANGDVEIFKFRLVAKGYSQQEGLDYHDTFSPVAKMVTVRCVVALAMSKGWYLYQMDVYNAFLQGDLDEEVYMHLPEGLQQKGQHKVCRLL